MGSAMAAFEDLNATAQDLAGLWLAGHVERVLSRLTANSVTRREAARRCYLAVATHRELIKAEMQRAGVPFPPSAALMAALHAESLR